MQHDMHVSKPQAHLGELGMRFNEASGHRGSLPDETRGPPALAQASAPHIKFKWGTNAQDFASAVAVAVFAEFAASFLARRFLVLLPLVPAGRWVGGGCTRTSCLPRQGWGGFASL